jgi:type VI protein secretion system component VasK
VGVVRAFRWFCLVMGVSSLAFTGLVAFGPTSENVNVVATAPQMILGLAFSLLLIVGAVFAILRDRTARRRRKDDFEKLFD